MEFEISVEPERSFARVTIAGDFDLQAVAESIIQLANHPALDSHFSVLVDLRGSGDALPGLEDLEAVAGLLELRKGALQGPIAAVSGRGDLFNLVHLSCMHAAQRGLRIRAFEALDEAERWLSEQAPDAPPARR